MTEFTSHLLPDDFQWDTSPLIDEETRAYLKSDVLVLGFCKFKAFQTPEGIKIIRWDPFEGLDRTHYREASLEEYEKLSDERLKAKGVIKVNWKEYLTEKYWAF